MMIMALSTLLITSVLTLALSNTPIMLGINILMMALLLAAVVSASMSTWYAFLVFLIYIGGMLVMFAYFLALVPNQQMASYMNPMFIVVISTMMMLITLYSNVTMPIQTGTSQESSFMYLPTTSPVIVLLALILLLTMVIVVKLTSRIKGPLRPFSYV